MSNYTQNIYFASKDALSTGDPLKKIKGSEVDAEFAEIETAIATKEDASAKGQANGYAPLNASVLLADSYLTTNIPRLNSAAAFTSTLTVGSTLGVTGDFAVNTNKFTVAAISGNTVVGGTLSVTSTLGVTGASNLAGLSATTGVFSSTLGVTGDFAVNTNKFTVAALSGNTVVAGTLGVTGTLTGAAGAFSSLTVGGVNVLTTSSAVAESQITDSTILARVGSAETITGAWTFSTAPSVPASTVTAHQGSLSIAESQIADGSILARIAAAETISGAWTFSGAGTITRSGQGRFVYLNGSGNTGGAITLSTSAATGTPGNGDIWIQHAA